VSLAGAAGIGVVLTLEWVVVRRVAAEEAWRYWFDHHKTFDRSHLVGMNFPRRTLFLCWLELEEVEAVEAVMVLPRSYSN